MFLTLIRSAFFVAFACGLLSNGAASAQNDRLIESKESLYNNIYVYQRPPYVIMTFGHNKQIYTESVINSGDELDLPVPYTRFMTASLMYVKDIHSILEIGFGGGSISWYLHRSLPDVHVTSVELDPVVVGEVEDGFRIVFLAMPSLRVPICLEPLLIIIFRYIREGPSRSGYKPFP